MSLITNFSKSDEYRKKIHTLIPGGAHTYSKGDDQFPLLSPAAISHGKGAYIWDVDGNKFMDCSMGLTSVTLGHAYEPVLARVREQLEKGVNFPRPGMIEMEMAEKFLGIVKVHDMIKFAKNGSSVTTAAVKLARAYTGRKLVAFPGDHPFYSFDDWFIGKTVCPRGVPEEIQALSVTYKSDDINSLSALFDQYPGQIACVISEPEKSVPPSDGYLASAIELAHRHGAIYINDEMITGYKTGFPGSMSKWGVVPDLSTWGKGIANGFSFTALTGKKEIMELGGIMNKGAEKVFLVSTTHGGETHSIAAGLATIEEYEKLGVTARNHATGDAIIRRVRAATAAAGLSDFLKVSESGWLPLFSFFDKKGEVSMGLKSVAQQEMIRRGVLFQGLFVPSISHSENEVNLFVTVFTEMLGIYQKALEEGWEKYLTGEPVKAVFRKYL